MTTDEHTYDDIQDDTSKATYLKRQVHAIGFVHQEHAERRDDTGTEHDQTDDTPPARMRQSLVFVQHEKVEGDHEERHHEHGRPRRDARRDVLQNRKWRERLAQLADIVVALRLLQDPLAVGVGLLDVILPRVVPRCVFPSLVLRAQFEGALVGGLVAKDEHAGGDDREAHERADREELDEHVDLDDEGHRAAGDARDEDGGKRGLRARVDVR